MTAQSRVIALALGAAALAGAHNLEGQSNAPTITGVFTASRSKWRTPPSGDVILVELTLKRSSPSGQTSVSESVPLSDLRGLDAAQLNAASADARFSWDRDAGSFKLEGKFVSGEGAGHFTFEPNPAYVADLRRAGYEVDDEKAFTLAIHDVSRSFLSDLSALGYPHPTLEECITLRIHGASAEYIRSLQALGYAHLTLQELVTFRIHGVSPEFVKALSEMGLAGQPHELVTFRIHGVSPEFVKGLRDLGFTHLQGHDLVNFRIHGVSPEYIRAFRDLGYRELTPEELVSMRIHGVGPDLPRDLRKLGYDRVPVQDLVNMCIHGVTADFVQKMQQREGKTVSVDRAIQARILGQEP